ncbi:FAD-binding oxidoreductase [Streptomyces parvus]|uniref:NAD(P)/FAD-dependent oxidoreductase n=1 Tax=Streptomyces parvus TaxID=66428 RepID=UPI001239D9D6|nr:FAD-binding oxidoreductase [Streptomyces parvus]KAA6202467.1 FAD-binding oxidoreductase [Streptomyces parvus]GGS49199.1 oxidoreductase [Streptomyces parvus]
MTGGADVVVIGGGINGASTAFHLATRGAGHVVLLDTPSPRSATAKSGAMVTVHHASLPESLLAHQGLLELGRVPELTGGETGLTRTGIVHLLPARFTAAMRDNVAAQRSAGIPVRELDPTELRQLWPGGDFADVGAAVIEPSGGYADPLLTTRAYLDGARRAGAEIQRASARRLLVAKGRVRGVETDSGAVIGASAVVLAAGVWSAGLLAALGLDLGLTTRRVQVAAFRTEPGAFQGGPVLLDQVRGSWFRPDTRTSVLAGLEWALPVDGPGDGPEGVDQWYVELCRQHLAGRFAGLRGAPMRGGWAGLVAMGPGSRPVVDHLTEATGLYCVVGDSGSSFKTAPIVGKRLAEWIVDGAPAGPELAPLARSLTSRPAPGDGYGNFASAAALSRQIHRMRRTTAPA